MKTPSIKKTLTRKAVKATAKHSARGTASKLRGDPIRSGTLLTVGALTGAVAGWLLARSAGQPSAA